ncbi:TIGR02710 family CRISPR-associated protein [Candidatus Sumerlaeota bacterium]|nr:TIGR02710 family CRISPR-associated protein [Candidatus Sumerlaeota bacterium]
MTPPAKENTPSPGLCYIVTVGTTYPGSGADVVEALIDDLRPAAPRKVVVLATKDSVPNGERILKALGLSQAQSRIRILKSAQSLDEAYLATAEEIMRLRASGIEARDIILQYTAGTKVMSAGAVLAAVNHDVNALRYLFSSGPKGKSTPVTTPISAIVADSKFQLVVKFTEALRFRSANNIIQEMHIEELTAQQQEYARVLGNLTYAYADWDNFRVKDFLRRYKGFESCLRDFPALSRFKLTNHHLTALASIRKAATADDSFPDELIIDIVNNAIRRLVERRPDDALIRLHRAAELYAQALLKENYDIRTDDVEIRKVPPRNRMAFESERRLDDAKIKLGLRKSYELLEILGHPVGIAFRDHQNFRNILDERRNFVLAHGTRPATTKVALAFYAEVEALLTTRIPNFRARAAAQQFPWIDNEMFLSRLSRVPAGDETSDLNREDSKNEAATMAKPPARKKRAG